MLWISSLNINKIKHFERIKIRWANIQSLTKLIIFLIKRSYQDIDEF